MSVRAWRTLRRGFHVVAVITWAAAGVQLLRGVALGRNLWWVAYLLVWPAWQLTEHVTRSADRDRPPSPSD